MKRTILTILLALACCVLAKAQITNKIWNLTLRLSTKQQVLSVINSRHLKIREKGTDYITCYPTKFTFGGETWNYAKFYFFNGKLLTISFSYTCPLSVRESFDRLQDSLDSKYYNYISDKNFSTYGDWWIDYDDGKTSISLSYQIVQGTDYISIMYSDDRLLLKQGHQSQSEL